MSKTPKDKKDGWLYSAFVLLGIGIVFLFFPYKILNGLELFGYYINIKDFGDLGSFIGGVTTPFLSIAAFILLYRTYKSQKEELDQTRKIMQAQNETMGKQQFESTFFKMIDLYNSVVNSMKLHLHTPSRGLGYGDEKSWEGRHCFDRLYSEYRNHYEDLIKENPKEKNELVLIQTALINLMGPDTNSHYLNHYQRNLFQILTFIDTSTIKDKLFYSNILKTQFSVNELLMLLYLGLSPSPMENMKELIEKYSLFEHIKMWDTLYMKHIIEYDPIAFGEKNIEKAITYRDMPDRQEVMKNFSETQQ